MRRSALFLLTLHLAAAPVLAQTSLTITPSQIAAPGVTMPPSGMPAPDYSQPPTPPVMENLVNFDPLHAEVAWSENHWQVVADGQLLKDFGRREIEARVAVRLMHDLHLTQHGVVGGPQPIMEYWLSDGRAPHGFTTGLHMMPLDPPLLRVEQTQGQWCVRDNNRVLFSFGTHEADARDALAIIRKYNFSQIGFLGDAGPSMLVMLGHADADTNDPNMPHLPPHHSPLHPASTNDPHAATMQQHATASTNDLSSMVTPAIPPLRSLTDTHKETVNAFGKTETVDVLPMADTSPTKPHRLAPLSPAALELIDRTEFDWRQVQVRPEGGHYFVAAGTFVLGRFNNDHDARIAQAAVQHYRFTELNHIGRPQAFASYYLSNGAAPLGQYLGVHADTFQPEKLTVAQIEHRWAIVTPEKPLLWFGTRVDEANVMLDVIQREQFDRLCHIGDDRGLTFFVRSH